MAPQQTGNVIHWTVTLGPNQELVNVEATCDIINPDEKKE